MRSADQLFDAIKDIDKSEGLRIQKEKLNEIRNFDDDFDSFDSILDAIDNLQDVKSYDSLYKSVYFNLISKLRMFKNVIKKFISYNLNLNPIINLFNKEKIGDRMKKKNFVKNLNHINNFEKIKNLKIKQIAPEVFLLDSLEK